MQLFWTSASPFVRKAMVSIHELKLEKRIEIVPTTWPHEWATRTVEFDKEFIAANPVGRIPALVTDDGIAICEFEPDLPLPRGSGQRIKVYSG